MNIHEETLKIARNLIKKDPSLTDWVISKFPELKEDEESRDERIRKDMIETIKKESKDFPSSVIAEKSHTWLIWLEKRGEQKSEVKYVYTKFRIGDVIVEIKPNGYCQPVRVKYVGEESYSCESDDEKRFLSFPIISQDEYKLIEQKPADKFEIGDLITNGILVGKIDEIHELGYHAYFGDHYADVPDIEKWHKWTIQDAKDGDVLFTSSTASHETFIFKSIDEKGNAKCYFAYDSEDGFREGKYHFIGRSTNCKPATKEQRDLLFQKMKEAGYEWNSEKKELKKINPGAPINQKKTPIEGEFPYDNPSDTLEGEIENIWGKLSSGGRFSATKDGFREVITHFVNYIKDQNDRELVEQKPTWSGEDEHCFENCLYAIKETFKEVNNPHRVGTIDWLKSLKYRCTWKPSEEQMAALLVAVGDEKKLGSDVSKELYELYLQLKQL